LPHPRDGTRLTPQDRKASPAFVQIDGVTPDVIADQDIGPPIGIYIGNQRGKGFPRHARQFLGHKALRAFVPENPVSGAVIADETDQMPANPITSETVKIPITVKITE